MFLLHFVKTYYLASAKCFSIFLFKCTYVVINDFTRTAIDVKKVRISFFSQIRQNNQNIRNLCCQTVEII